MSVDLVLEFLNTLLRVNTPILWAGLAVLISDRAGVFNIGVEGMMLLGALFGVLGSAFTGNVWLGLACAVAVGAASGALLGFASIVLRADIVIAGIALNVGASAGTTLLLFLVTGEKGISGSLASGVLPGIDLGVVKSIPLVGPIISGQHVLTYLGFAAVPLTYLLLNRTVFGMRVRASGEDPFAARTAGIGVERMQFSALLISGALASVGGAFLSMGYVSWFGQNMTAGRGFIAVAAEVIGRGTPLGTMAGSILLSSAEAASIFMQRVGLPSELMQTIPYVVPVVALTIYGYRRHAGAARGMKRGMKA